MNLHPWREPGAPANSCPGRLPAALRSTERGEGRVGFLIALILLAILIFLGVKIIPVRITAYDFKDHIREECRRAAIHGSVDRLTESILDKAHELDLPLSKKNLSVKKTRQEMTVEARYQQPIDLKVYTYTYRFDVIERAPMF